MQSYQEMSREELLREKESLEQQYKEICKKGLKLDMSRGKPSKEQLELSMPMMDVLTSETPLVSRAGTDIRNYGVIDGITEGQEFIASLVGLGPEAYDNVIVYGNASLNIMYDCISRSMLFGVNGSTPWCKLDKVKWLCPVPGYDRHFAITECFGIEMINVPLYEDGPDMDMVEKLVSEDDSIKGIWCVPKYSNPMGTSYSDETVRRLARLKPAAEDFRIYWDNAYCVHDLYEDKADQILEILGECEKAGNPNLPIEFCSTSKITFSGAGVSGLITSLENKADILKRLTIQTIGFDKINQLRHVKFLKDIDGVKAHMAKHAAIIRPKFEMILDRFEEELEGLGAGSWIRPNGGYFITFKANEGCAKNIVAKAKEAGVVLTGAGAPYPYKKDPKDSVIRIAPTLPPMEELKEACEVFIVCAKLASVEKLLEA